MDLYNCSLIDYDKDLFYFMLFVEIKYVILLLEGEIVKKKNQHYVPKFHLRQWSSDGKLISLYNKYNHKFVDNKCAIKNMASGDYLYDKNGEVETLLGKIESKLAPLYKKIIEQRSLCDLTDYERELLYLHFILCDERTDAAGKDYEELITKSLQATLKIGQVHGKYIDLDADTIKDKICIQFPCNNAIRSALKYYPLIMDLKISLIENTSNVQFITSDYPCIKYNLWSTIRKLYSGWGMSSVGIMYILPISPQFALIAYDPVVYSIKCIKKNVVKIKSESYITEINRLMLINSNQNIFFSPGIPVHYINKLLSPIIEYIKPPKTVQLLGNTESVLIANNVRRINYKANIKFLSVLPESLEWSVPPHAAGLLRPTSEDIAKQIRVNL